MTGTIRAADIYTLQAVKSGSLGSRDSVLSDLVLRYSPQYHFAAVHALCSARHVVYRWKN